MGAGGRRAELAGVAVALVSAVALTWPLAARFGTEIAGNAGDPLQTLWSWRWLHDALLAGKWPFFTDRLFHPAGASLVFQTFDLPTAILALPLWHVLPPIGVYDAGVLFAFALSAYGAFRLVRELTDDVPVALGAGVLFAATPYHLAHALGHQHLLSMGWLPLGLVHVHRLLDDRASRRDVVLAGLFLGLSALASWYHALFAAVLLPVLAVKRGWTRGAAKRAAAAVLGAMVVAGPLAAAMLVERGREPVTGSHDPREFSADLEAFVHPNAAQRWSDLDDAATRWTGNGAENAVYPGWILLGLAVWAAARGRRWSRAYVAVALAGAVLALGPALHVGGRVTDVAMPYAALAKIVPLVEFAGVPVRFGFLLYFGAISAAAIGMAALRRERPRTGAVVAIVGIAGTLVEWAPRPLTTTPLKVPAPMLAWAEDGRADEAVLDISDTCLAMWHGTLHRKPLAGGFLTRVPQRLVDAYVQDPVIGPLLVSADWAVDPHDRRDAAVDFAWKDSPIPELWPTRFAVRWSGKLEIPGDSARAVRVESDGLGTLEVDGEPVEGPLPPGSHTVVVRYLHDTGPAHVRLLWDDAPVPASAFPQGLQARYQQLPAHCGFGRDEARESLKARQIRWIVTADVDNPCVTDELALAPTYRGEGVRIYELPGAEISDGPR